MGLGDWKGTKFVMLGQLTLLLLLVISLRSGDTAPEIRNGNER